MGLPLELSVKVTVWPALGELGEKVNAAMGTEVLALVEESDDPFLPPQLEFSKIPSRIRSIMTDLLTLIPDLVTFEFKPTCSSELVGLVTLATIRIIGSAHYGTSCFRITFL